MELLLTKDIARKSVVHCVREFNNKFSYGCSVIEIEQLRQECERRYKIGESVTENFEMYSLLDVIILIAETLCLDYLKDLDITDEEVDLVAEELLKKWS